jgi:hypothetical protein
MVTVIDYKIRQTESNEEFYVLILQGSIAMVQSKETGKFYATAMTASVSSTFDELTCKALIGQQMPGNIAKVECEEFDYTIESTGEVITMKHNYQYVPEEMTQPTNEVVEAVIH